MICSSSIRCMFLFDQLLFSFEVTDVIDPAKLNKKSFGVATCATFYLVIVPWSNWIDLRLLLIFKPTFIITLDLHKGFKSYILYRGGIEFMGESSKPPRKFFPAKTWKLVMKLKIPRLICMKKKNRKSYFGKPVLFCVYAHKFMNIQVPESPPPQTKERNETHQVPFTSSIILKAMFCSHSYRIFYAKQNRYFYPPKGLSSRGLCNPL